MKLWVLFLLLLFLNTPVRADSDCAQELRAHIAGNLAIVKGMADFKAAMDAGYAACTVNYPEEFAPLRDANDFMQTNMQREMDQARAVVNHLIDNPSKPASKSCAVNETERKTVKEEVAHMLDGQYSKAYARRYRVMAQADLVGEDRDSCRIILKMAEQYQDYYRRFDRVQNILYETSKKQGKLLLSGKDKKSFSQFESTRDRLFTRP